MSETAIRAASTRGQETRERILDAALVTFGREGFEQATTRRIAERADVALPAIRYYFDHKEGLYLACAREIVARYQAGIGDFMQSVVADLDNGCSPEVARSHLKAVMRRVFEIAGAPGSEPGTAFVMREMSEQGPAFDVLYRDLWNPGMQVTAALIARARDLPGPDDDTHLQALMLHASFSAFTVTLPVSTRYLDESGSSDDSQRRATTMALLDAQIDQLDRARV